MDIDLLSMGQDLSIMSDELDRGAKALANLQADVEDISMFGKDKNNIEYAKENTKIINELTATMDQRIEDLKTLKEKISQVVSETEEYINRYNNHIYSK